MLKSKVLSVKGERPMKRIALMMFVVLFACSVILIFAADQKGMSGIVIAKKVYNYDKA
jgi:hypothetical protein